MSDCGCVAQKPAAVFEGASQKTAPAARNESAMPLLGGRRWKPCRTQPTTTTGAKAIKREKARQPN